MKRLGPRARSLAVAAWLIIAVLLTIRAGQAHLGAGRVLPEVAGALIALGFALTIHRRVANTLFWSGVAALAVFIDAVMDAMAGDGAATATGCAVLAAAVIVLVGSDGLARRAAGRAAAAAYTSESDAAENHNERQGSCTRAAADHHDRRHDRQGLLRRQVRLPGRRAADRSDP